MKARAALPRRTPLAQPVIAEEVAMVAVKKISVSSIRPSVQAIEQAAEPIVDLTDQAQAGRTMPGASGCWKEKSVALAIGEHRMGSTSSRLIAIEGPGNLGAVHRGR